MLVHEVMSVPVVTVRARDGVLHAADVLLLHGVASAPVVDDSGTLVGVVGEADLLRGRSGQDPRAHLGTHLAVGAPVEGSVADVMTAPARTLSSTADAAEAARTLLELGVSALPVVEHGRVVGVVARRDLLRALVRPDAAVRTEVDVLLNGPAAAAAGVVRSGGGRPAGTRAGTWVVAVTDAVVTLTPGHGWHPDAADHRLAVVLAREVPGARVVVLGATTSTSTTTTETATTTTT